jgi:phosphate-selective porin OprO/OprP
MSKAQLAAAATIGLIGALVTSQARAQSAGADAEIAALKQQLRLMEQKLDKLQKQTTANTAAAATANAKADAKVGVASANAAYPVKGPIAASGVVVTMPNNRPTICTADDQNCIAITSRVHFDVGGYDYRPNSAATVPQRLDDGVNVRRARIGVIGKFMGDWNYALIYDFGGASDGFDSTASVGGATVGFLPGGALSGIENAYLSYTGFKPFGGNLAIEGGVMDLPYTLDEASSSNDIPFMERAASGITATNIAAGDFRSTFGTRWYTDRFWAGALSEDGGYSLCLQHQPSRHDGTIWHDRPRRRTSPQRRQLLAAYRRRCRMADPAAAQSDSEHANADPERPSGIAHRSDHGCLEGCDRRRLRRPSLQRRSGRDVWSAVLPGRIFLVQCRS